MEVEILTNQFKKALNISEKITRKAITLPALANVLITTQGNFLELTTTNLETTIHWRILANVKKQGKAMVPATFLANLINLVDSEKIEISEENQNLIITAQNQKNRIQGQNPEDFPIIPKVKKENSWQVMGSQLIDGLAQIIDIPSISQIRPEISGIYFSLEKDRLKIVGTDSFRLAEKTIKLESKEQKANSFILPQSTSRELINILSQEDFQVDVFSEPNQVLFEFKNQEDNQPKIEVLSRLIEGQYPNYQEIIPKKNNTKIQSDKELLIKQIKKAGLFSGKVLEVKLSTDGSKKQLKVFSQSAEAGSNESFISTKIEGDAFEISFNHRFLIDGLVKIKSSEVILELSGQEGPGVLKPVGDTSYLYILMPIKAN